jgi:hypothetical protein
MRAVIRGLMAGNELPIPSDPDRDTRRAILAAMFGAIMLVVGLVLWVGNLVVYVGSWPDERPMYLAGIGVVLFFMGIIALAAGLVLSRLFRREAGSQPDASVRGP